MAPHGSGRPLRRRIWPGTRLPERGSGANLSVALASRCGRTQCGLADLRNPVRMAADRDRRRCRRAALVIAGVAGLAVDHRHRVGAGRDVHGADRRIGGQRAGFRQRDGGRWLPGVCGLVAVQPGAPVVGGRSRHDAGRQRVRCWRDRLVLPGWRRAHRQVPVQFLYQAAPPGRWMIPGWRRPSRRRGNSPAWQVGWRPPRLRWRWLSRSPTPPSPACCSGPQRGAGPGYCAAISLLDRLGPADLADLRHIGGLNPPYPRQIPRRR